MKRDVSEFLVLHFVGRATPMVSSFFISHVQQFHTLDALIPHHLASENFKNTTNNYLVFHFVCDFNDYEIKLTRFYAN